jgi:tRNA (mo5U34)-methyltransferase
MLDLKLLFEDLQTAGLESWAATIEPLLNERMSENAHGNFAAWRDAIASLPDVVRKPAKLNSDVVGTPKLQLSSHELSAARDALIKLSPWRKGPFDIGGISIDSEWRSDLKWARVRDAISPLEGRLVLDVGCGNGYYSLRMRGEGARTVIGIDPTLLYVLQYRAFAHFVERQPVHVLPLRLEELPSGMHAFDSVFSMGVLYHQRSPLTHLGQLRDALTRGGELVLETLILPGEDAFARTPENRYARMRNVWLLPSIKELTVWLERSGFKSIRIADSTRTTTHEQRSTEWMPFDSLQQALDPDDPTKTVEGWPAPLRVVIIADSPG